MKIINYLNIKRLGSGTPKRWSLKRFLTSSLLLGSGRLHNLPQYNTGTHMYVKVKERGLVRA